MVDNGFIDYTLFALTAQYQIVPIELTLRSEDPVPDFPAPPHPHSTSSSIPQDGYISLLTTSPFSLPKFTVSRLPSTFLPSGADSTITPDALRSLGKRAESLRSDMRDMTSGVNTVQARIGLQNREMERQLAKLAEMERLIVAAPASGEGSGAIGARVAKVAEEQRAIVARLDKVLQRLMDSYSPKLSEYEVRWFGELGRMQKEVAGGGKSLKDRTELVSFFLSFFLWFEVGV